MKKKKQNSKIFCLEESRAIQCPYQNNQGPFWYTNDLTENTGLRYFLYRMKKIQKSSESENHQVAFTCQLYKSRRNKTRQSNYEIWQHVKVLNSKLSMHSTLWILKKANSKMHALCRSVTIVYECGCVLAAHVSIMYTVQICLIRTNPKAFPSYWQLTEKTVNERTRWNKSFFQVPTWE